MRLPVTVHRPDAGALPIDRSEVLRYLGYKRGVTRVEARHEELVDQGIAMAVATAEPVASVAFCEVDVAGGAITTRVPGLTWRSQALAKVLGEVTGVSLVAATVGAQVETLTQQLFASDEFALATIVDAASSALVQALGRWVSGQIGASASGLTLTPLYGPGYGDWDIHDQSGVTTAAGGPAIGLISTETCFLIPQKSLVGVIGWTVGGGRKGSGCALCTMPDCAYRSRPSEGRMT